MSLKMNDESHSCLNPGSPFQMRLCYKSFNGLITLLAVSVHCGLNYLSLYLSRHKGVVTNIIEGTTSLAVTLDDGKVKTLELGKQGVRFVPQKQKRSRT